MAAQRADPSSVLHLVRRLVALRRETPALGLAGETEVLHAGYPFVYLRGGTHLVVVNPSGRGGRGRVAPGSPVRAASSSAPG